MSLAKLLTATPESLRKVYLTFAYLTRGGEQITSCFPTALFLHPTFSLLNLDHRQPVFLQSERTEGEDCTFHKRKLNRKHHSDNSVHTTQVVSSWTCVFSVTERNNILPEAPCFVLRFDGWQQGCKPLLTEKLDGKYSNEKKPKMTMCWSYFLW